MQHPYKIFSFPWQHLLLFAMAWRRQDLAKASSAAVLVPSEALPGCSEWHKPTRPTICSPWAHSALFRVADDHSQHPQAGQWKEKTSLGFLGWVQAASEGGHWSEVGSFGKANFGNSQLRAF